MSDVHYSRIAAFREQYDRKETKCPFCGNHGEGTPLSCYYLSAASKCNHYKKLANSGFSVQQTKESLPNLTLPEALAVIYSYSPALMQIHPGDREMLAEAQRVVSGSASGTRERFREAASGTDQLKVFTR
jgi:hypothetical protein